MKYEVRLEKPPAGYSLSAARGGESVQVSVREFTSTEDGDLFMTRLEGFPSEILARLPEDAQVRPSMVDSMVAIIDRRGLAVVHLNERAQILVRTRRSIELGERVYDDDIADIERLEFEDVAFPTDCGVAVLLSVGWRKGFYYDFAPIIHPFRPRQYSMPRLLGRYFSYLSYQQLFKMKDEDWEQFFAQRWFPFIGLKMGTVKRMIKQMKSGWSIDELMDQIVAEVKELAPRLCEKWRCFPYFREHEKLFATAVERFLAGDHASATSILFPRIEGLLRSIVKSSRASEQYNQSALVAAAAGGADREEERLSKLLPSRFREFIEEVYFANFAPDRPADLSRHSVAHGVAATADFSQKSSAIGLLILDQIFYYQLDEPTTSAPQINT